MTTCRALIRTCTDKKHSLLTDYRRLAILINDLDEMASVLLPIWKMATIFPTVFATYAVTKLDGVVRGFAAIYAFLCLTTLQLVIKFAAEITTESNRFLKDFKRYGLSRRNGIHSKILAAFRPLRISVRKMYFLDKGLMITIMRIILENTIMILLLRF